MSGGGNVLSPRVIQNLFEDVESSGGPNGNGHAKCATEYNLTQREHDILALLSEGRSNREIAQNLYLSEKTVKAHLAAIFRKLGVTNRTQAAMMAVQMGVGPAPAGDGRERVARASGVALRGELLEEPAGRRSALSLVLALRAVDPYGTSAGVDSRKNEIWPIFMPG